jgi:hypothetical protein
MKLRRLFYFLGCAVLGVILLGCGLLIPAHWSAEDAAMLQTAAHDTPSLMARAKSAAGNQRLGDAVLLDQAALNENISEAAPLAAALTNLVAQNPSTLFWGNDSNASTAFGNDFNASQPLTEFVIRSDNRDAALAQLQNTTVAGVGDLLHTRSLNNTIMLPASGSASGQAFDAGIAICGLLMDENRLTKTLSDEISGFASQANNVGNSAPLERTLMDFLSLGQRFNWDQMTVFVENIPDVDVLDELADQARNAGDNLPVLFAAVQLSGNPAGVSDYLSRFPQTGYSDIGTGLRAGTGGVQKLAGDGKRFYSSGFERRFTDNTMLGAIYLGGAGLAVKNLDLAMALKWLLYLLAGFSLAMALHFAAPPLDPSLRVRGFHVARESLFSVGFLLAVLLLSEPFLAQESQKGEHFSFRLLSSVPNGSIPAGIAGITQTVMNPTIMITLLVFFILQALLYTSCLVKLAEIRRQRIPPRMKLKLLENEDHLFDAGLYLGFVGTIVSLIIASLGLVKFSLMAAYSSTSFGIIFVVIFKIFHLRPLRRQLLMEAEMQSMAEDRRASTPHHPGPASLVTPAPTPAIS